MELMRSKAILTLGVALNPAFGSMLEPRYVSLSALALASTLGLGLAMRTQRVKCRCSHCR